MFVLFENLIFGAFPQGVSPINNHVAHMLARRVVARLGEGVTCWATTDRLVLKIEGNSRQGDEYADVAVKTFELSQSLRERWVTADCAIKRQILETLCLNCTLETTNLVATLRSPFEVLRKYPVSKIGRGGGI